MDTFHPEGETKTLTGKRAIDHLVKDHCHNNMDPHLIVRDLVAFKSMYKKFDLVGNDVWYDCIHIKGIKEENIHHFISIIQTWKPDEFHWCKGKGKKRQVKKVDPRTAIEDMKEFEYLRIWWD